MTGAAAVILAGGLAEIGNVVITVLTIAALAIGSLVMLRTVLFALLRLVATRGQQEPLRTPTQPSRVMPEIDGALPLFFRHVPTADEIGAEVDEWLKDGGHG